MKYVCKRFPLTDNFNLHSSDRNVSAVFVHAVVLVLFLKTALSLALVRFWWFLVHSIHSGAKYLIPAKCFIEACACARVVRPWDFNQSQSIIKNREGTAPSTLAAGRGNKTNRYLINC